MDFLTLTHPVERLLLALTALAFLMVIYWKAGEPTPSRATAQASPAVQSS